MKFFVPVCLVVFFVYPKVESKSFRFGDFFFGETHKSTDTDKRSSPPDDAEVERSSNDSIPLNHTSEGNLDIINSSSEGEFIDADLWNSSDSFGTTHNSSMDVIEDESDVTTVTHVKQSVKKVLSVQDSPKSSTLSFTTSNEQHTTAEESASRSEATETVGFNVTSNTNEIEEVVLGTTKVPMIPNEKTIFQKSIEWVEDAYTLSILIPVAAGILFATTCITTIAICGCLRRCCRRRRLRRKVLPDAVKSLRASDRARLLGDCSSDEEF